MKQALPWVISIITIAVMLLIGNKIWWAWLIGLGTQVLWIIASIWYGTWGYMLLTGFLIVIYTRNMLKWRREQKITMPIS